MREIDLTALQDARAHAENMVAYYGKNADKIGVIEVQNAALAAAGLPPVDLPPMAKWDRDQRDRFQRQQDALDAVLAHFAAEVRDAA